MSVIQHKKYFPTLCIFVLIIFEYLRNKALYISVSRCLNRIIKNFFKAKTLLSIIYSFYSIPPNYQLTINFYISLNLYYLTTNSSFLIPASFPLNLRLCMHLCIIDCISTKQYEKIYDC